MENQIFSDINTVLDLNGPILSIIQQPANVTGIGTSVGGTGGASVELVGIATATFVGTGIANSSGTFSYQWYQSGGGALSDSTYISGATTSTLTVSNLITPDDNGNEYYVQVDYVPTYVGLGTGYQTGNALNEPIQSETAIITVTPLLEIIAQPSSVDTLVNTSRTLTVNATLSDNSFADDLTYQWYIIDSDGTPQIITGNLVSTTTASSTTTTAGMITTVRTPVSQSYSSPGTHTIPTTAESITFTLAGARGGNGGNANQGSGGGGGGGRSGSFSVPTGYRGSQFGFYIGSRGSGGAGGQHNHSGGAAGSGHPDGGTGGKSGIDNSGRTNSAVGSGAGGGGGGASTLLIDGSTIAAIAAGGGGGGGGTHQRDAPGGSVGSEWFGAPVSYKGGGAGDQGSGWEGAGGGGGGGGGADKPGNHVTRGYGDGGQAGSSSFTNAHYVATSGIGGEGGASAYTGFTLNSQGGNGGDGSGSISYTNVTTQTSAPEVVVTWTTVTNTIKFSGFNTKTLTLEADYQTVRNFLCRVSSATASNAAMDSETAAFSVLPVLGENQIVVESITNTASAEIEDINLNNGEYLFEGPDNTTVPNILYSFYAPNNDIDVEMDLYGGRGEDNGGEGGYSRIQFTMEQNVEYVLVGLTPDIRAPFLYRKGELMAVVGGGGAGPLNGNGTSGGHGDGGGINLGGSGGSGARGGSGGDRIASGNLPSNGIFGSATTPTIVIFPDKNHVDLYGQNNPTAGGRTIPCTRGVYWAQQGKGACEDIGTVKFRLGDGTEVTNTSASITRGFKAGYNIMQTKGKGENGGGEGGSGATGGQGATDPDAGGGGGSGYQDGSVTVINTMQGGSTGNAKVVLRVAT